MILGRELDDWRLTDKKQSRHVAGPVNAINLAVNNQRQQHSTVATTQRWQCSQAKRYKCR